MAAATALALDGGAAAPAVAASSPPLAAAPAAPDVWVVGVDGRSFRVAFDPGERLFVGAGFATHGTAGGSSLSLGLSLRAAAPDGAPPVFWKRDHHILH